MTLTQLEAFVLVARLGSVKAAAKVLGVTEPAVSGALAALRQHLGDPLVERTPTGMNLTAGGKRLVTIASQMVNLAVEAEAAIRDAQGAPELLRVVATSTVAEFMAPSLLAVFTGRAAAVEASVGLTTEAEMSALLLERLADIGLGPRLPDLVSEPLMRYRLVVVASPRHHLAARPVADAALAGQDWLVGPAGADPSSDVARLLRRLAVEAETRPELPSGFEDRLVAPVELPTAVTFTPDGEMLAASQTGRLWRIEDGRLVATPVLDLSGRLCPRLEQGLLGVAVHPRYESTRWIYVFWTHDVEGCVHRVSRFTVRPDGVADPGSERVLVDRIPSPNGNHNGGDLHFGPDGYLYDCGTLFRLQPTDDGDYQELVFVDGLGASNAVHMVFGPSPFGQSLYYTTYAAGGQIRRLDHIGAADRPPVAELRASPLHGPTPLTVRLDAGASRAFGAPDRLRYRFDFGDDTGLLDTPAAVVEHTYHAEGPHTASVVAEDSQGRRSGPATVVIHPGESPPVPSITGPDRRYGVGDPVRIEGTATDAQDGAVPPERLTWRVLLHHEDHTHPFLGPLTGTKLGFDFPRPESLRAAATSWREVRLTATDKAGLDATAVFEVRPRMVQLTFDTEPDGLRLLIDGRAETAPCTVASWPGLPVRLEAPDQDRDGKRFRFRRWSDGGARDHTIETPDEPTTWTATFRR